MKKNYCYFLKKLVSLLGVILCVMLWCGYSATSQPIIVDGNPEEWPGVLADPTVISAFVVDLKQLDGTDTQFTSGAKDFSSAREMVWSYSQVSDKNEITNAGVVVARINTDNIMYFFADRFSTNGSAEIGFWVFQNGTAPVDMPDGKYFDPEKELGDILILATFTQGGRVPNLEVYEWMGTDPYTGVDRLQIISPLDTTDAYAYVSDPLDYYPVPSYNDENYGPWEYCNKENKDCGKYYPGSFFEGMINLTSLSLEVDLCGATFLMETRQSHSLESAVNDFVGGSIGTIPEIEAEGDEECASDDGSSVEIELCATSEEMNISYQWYADSAMTSPIVEGDAACITVQVTETTRFWVVGTNEVDCSSVPVWADAVVLDNPVTSTEWEDALCYGDNGSVDLTVTGGTTPYSFLWSNAATTEDLASVPAGTYSVVVTDDNGCMAYDTVTVEEPPLLTASALATDALCYGENGSVDLTVTGGTMPYSFLWSNAATTEDLVSVPAGEYSVIVTDDNGCMAYDTVTVEEPPLLECYITDIIQGFCGESDGQATVVITGGTLPYDILWDNGETTETADSLSSGLHVVYITDANGCETQCDVEMPCMSKCETAYGMLEGNSTCFIDGGFENWGWTNSIVPPIVEEDTVYILPLFAGAADCDPLNGWGQVGTVTLTYGGGSLRVLYEMFNDYSLSEVHIYVGCAMYPTGPNGKLTTAPGQYTVNIADLDMVSGVDYTLSDVTGEIYVIAHAVVCEIPWTIADIGYGSNTTLNVNCGLRLLFEESSNDGNISSLSLISTGLRVYPNPFSDMVTFEFISPMDAHARLEITDLLGQRVAILLNKNVKKGVFNRIQYEPSSLVSGVLIYRLWLDKYVQVGRIIYKDE